jgi:hypothetical protein
MVIQSNLNLTLTKSWKSAEKTTFLNFSNTKMNLQDQQTKETKKKKRLMRDWFRSLRNSLRKWPVLKKINTWEKEFITKDPINMLYMRKPIRITSDVEIRLKTTLWSKPKLFATLQLINLMMSFKHSTWKTLKEKAKRFRREFQDHKHLSISQNTNNYNNKLMMINLKLKNGNCKIQLHWLKINIGSLMHIANKILMMNSMLRIDSLSSVVRMLKTFSLHLNTTNVMLKNDFI